MYGYQCDRCGERFEGDPLADIRFRYCSLAESPEVTLCSKCARDLRGWLHRCEARLEEEDME